MELQGFRYVIYKPIAMINPANVSSLEFHDLMKRIDIYSELRKEKLKKQMDKIIARENVNFDLVKKYISRCPLKTYQNIYDSGAMSYLIENPFMK